MLPFVLAVPPRAPGFLGAPLSSWEAQRRLVSDDVRARAEAHNGSYPVLNLTNASAPRVLGVTELSCEQPATLHDTFARAPNLTTGATLRSISRTHPLRECSA